MQPASEGEADGEGLDEEPSGRRPEQHPEQPGPVEDAGAQVGLRTTVGERIRIA